jgi:hypothetical protein
MRDDYDPTDPDAPQPRDVDPPDDSDDAYDDDDSDDDVIQCAACGRSLHALAAVCPHCGEWVLNDSDSPAAHRSRGWFWPLMVALLIAIILVLWSGLRM